MVRVLFYFVLVVFMFLFWLLFLSRVCCFASLVCFYIWFLSIVYLVSCVVFWVAFCFLCFCLSLRFIACFSFCCYFSLCILLCLFMVAVSGIVVFLMLRSSYYVSSFFVVCMTQKHSFVLSLSYFIVNLIISFLRSCLYVPFSVSFLSLFT